MNGNQGMRILVQTHSMEVGGSQFNAIELAEAVAARGNEVIVFGPPGSSWTKSVDEASSSSRRPLDARRPLPPLVESSSGSCASGASTSSMPTSTTHSSTPCTDPAGSSALRSSRPFCRWRFRSSSLGGPPCWSAPRSSWNTNDGHGRTSGCLNLPWTPGSTARGSRRSVLAADGTTSTVFEVAGVPHEKLVVIVCRLASELKLEGILTAIRAMVRVREHVPARLLIVGDGPERAEVERVITECTGRMVHQQWPWALPTPPFLRRCRRHRRHGGVNPQGACFRQTGCRPG